MYSTFGRSRSMCRLEPLGYAANLENIPETGVTPLIPVAIATLAEAEVLLEGPWLALLDDIGARSKRGSERKQDRSKRTEQQILNAALRVFARDGISRSRIADIAAEAGISTSTLYEYYKSKEDIAYEVPSHHLGSFFDAYRIAVEGKVSVHERLLLYLSMSADFAREHAEWARLFYLEIWPSVFVETTELRHSVNDFARVVVFLVRQGVDEGIFAPHHDPYETAALLIGGVNQVIITWLLYRRPKNLTRAGSDVTERMLRLLALEQAAEVLPPRRAKSR